MARRPRWPNKARYQTLAAFGVPGYRGANASGDEGRRIGL